MPPFAAVVFRLAGAVLSKTILYTCMVFVATVISIPFNDAVHVTVPVPALEPGLTVQVLPLLLIVAALPVPGVQEYAMPDGAALPLGGLTVAVSVFPLPPTKSSVTPLTVTSCT